MRTNRVLLVDADSANGFPNLALMKLSAYHKNEGDKVDLIKQIPESPPLEPYDFAYISCIFFQNRDRVKRYTKWLEESMLCDACVEVGGSGISNDIVLPYDIEHLMPDYDLYDCDFSLGFTSRGCIRKCPWCIVPEKEGPIHYHADIEEFHKAEHEKIILLDNNFLASSLWRKNLTYLIKNDLMVNFNQGLDIRTVTKEKSELLSQVRVMDWHFKKKKFTFAFDHPRYEDDVKKGVQLLRNAGIHLDSNNCVFYVLVGHSTTIYEDLDRIRTLIDLDVGPYVMRYNKAEGQHRILLHLARWVNRKYFQYVDFRDYDYSDSKESYKKIFPTGLDPSHPAYYCPQGAYNIDSETEEIISIQKELGEFD